MRRVFCVLTLIFCINIFSYSQIIQESIPEFAEKLLTLDKTSSENDIVNRGFRLLTTDELLSLGYDKESLVNLIVGVGDSQISCNIQTDNTGRHVEKVTVGGVRYLNAKYMVSEYKTDGYIMDEENSTRNELMFIKRTKEYIYAAIITFMVNPYMCLSNAEFRRVSHEDQLYIEQPVDWNDYFGCWDEDTDWNHTEIDSDIFDEVCKKNGIYWSDKKNSWVKKVLK